jgi:hypothetical protein
MSFMGGNGQGEALKRRWQRRLLRHLNNFRIWRMAREVLRQAPAPRGMRWSCSKPRAVLTI